MDSKELNEAIKKLCSLAAGDPEFEYEYVAFGGKPIPYIGWFWREVNFDAKTMDFGVVPASIPRHTERDSIITSREEHPALVGFMENNKWGYSSIWADEEEWARIKLLLHQAVITPSKTNLERVNKAIQALLE